MRRAVLGLTVPALLIAGLAFATVPAAAATTTLTPGSATYTVNYSCLYPCIGTYPHRYTAVEDCLGALSGTGVSLLDATVTETFTGRTFFDAVSNTTRFEFTAVYLTGNPGYTITAIGTVDSVTGDLKGTATGPGQTFSLLAARAPYTAPTCSTPPIVPPTVVPPTTDGDHKGSVGNHHKHTRGEADEVVERNDLKASSTEAESRD